MTAESLTVEPMAVPGAWVCTPRVHPDDRGLFLEWFRHPRLVEATGRRLDVAQANHSVSRRGVVRGLHFADVPPGQAKLVYCPTGAVLDVVVDLRVGSPTFGAVDSVVLDDVDRRAVFVAEGLGHGFCALRDDTAVSYLVSTTYGAAAERTVSPLDPTLALPWPVPANELVLSDKDASAPTLEAARESGILPTYQACTARYAELGDQS
jgi:dTDP-4-dehydrorhamnose 3,5-epimerase